MVDGVETRRPTMVIWIGINPPRHPNPKKIPRSFEINGVLSASLYPLQYGYTGWNFFNGLSYYNFLITNRI